MIDDISIKKSDHYHDERSDFFVCAKGDRLISIALVVYQNRNNRG
jgi:hypothetical protein